jgi:hypothetical protein
MGRENAQSTKAFLSVKTILDGWEANYGAIRSMKVDYSASITDANGNPLYDYRVERVQDGRLYHL